MALGMGTKPVEWWKQEPYRGLLKRNKPVKGEMGEYYKNGTFTGLGADGKLQPNNVTSINNFALHEGEYVVPADKVQALGGPNGVDAHINQGLLNAQAVGMRGFQTGGTISDIKIPDYSTQLDQIRAIASGDKPSSVTGFQTNQEKIRNARLAAGFNANQQAIKDARQNARQTANYNANQLAVRDARERAGYLSNQAAIQNARTSGLGNVGTQGTQGTQGTTGTGTNVGTTGIGGIGSAAYRTGLARLGDTDKMLRTGANIAQQQVAGANVAAQGALRQELAQAGVGSGAALAAQAEQSRQAGAEAAGVAAQTALGAQQVKFQAAGELASQGMAGMQFEEGKKRFDKALQQDALKTMIDNGDWTSAGKAFNDLYGSNIDFTNAENQEMAKNLSEANTAFRAAIDPTTSVADALGSADVRTAAQAKWDNLPDTVKSQYSGFDDFLTKEVNASYFQKTPLGETMATWDDNSISAMFPGISATDIPKARGAIMSLINSGGLRWDSATGQLNYDDSVIENILSGNTAPVETTPAVIPGTQTTTKIDFEPFQDEMTSNPFGDSANTIINDPNATQADKDYVYGKQADYLFKNPEEINIGNISKDNPTYKLLLNKYNDLKSEDFPPSSGTYKYKGNIINIDSGDKDTVITDPITGKKVTIPSNIIPDSGILGVHKNPTKLPNGRTIEGMNENGRVYGKTEDGKAWSGPWSYVVDIYVNSIL